MVLRIHKTMALRIVILVLTGIFVFACFMSAGDKPLLYVVGIVCLVLFGYQFIMLLRHEEIEHLVDKDEATEYYMKWIEDHRMITIPPDFREIFCDETDIEYRFVFSWIDQTTGVTLYAPIEINKYYVRTGDGKYKINLGHCRGVITENFQVVQAFMLRNVKASRPDRIVHVIEPIVDAAINNRLARDDKQNTGDEE